jgi:hypothetical protein
MIMKHFTKFQVSMISHLRGEVSKIYFKSSTPLGSTITQKKTYWILLSWQYAHVLMIMKHCTKFQVSMISHLRGEVNTSYSKPSSPLWSTVTQRKIINPPVLTICTSTNDNEAFYKVSSLYSQPSRREDFVTDWGTDGLTENTKTICLPHDEGRHN